MTTTRAASAFVFSLLASLALAAPTRGEDVPTSPPRPPGAPPRLSPEDSRKTIRPAPGLAIELVAAEPVVRQPLSISFDDRGRIWVLEYLQYPTPSGLKPVAVDQYLRTKYDRVPEPPPEGPKGIGEVVILEDPDASGRFRKAKEFLTGLDLASGMALGDGGLYVVQPPYLLFYADADGDDRPDGEPEVLLEGFGMEDAHAFANSLTWGPDGWLYGAQGSTVTAKVRGVEFQQGIWRYHPPTRRFELFAEGGGNTWGIDFDREGRLFAGGNTAEPLCHHVQGGYYWKGFAKHGPLHNPYTFGYINPVPHKGFLGSALTGGFVIYEGGLFPGRFAHSVIYPNLRENAVRAARLEPEGSTFATRFQEDFLLSTDRWFRPVKGLVGPDGALYLADWYDVNISHTDPKDRSKWYMPSKDTGRLWRVLPEGSDPRPDPVLPLAKRSSDALVDLLGHANTWYSREARRLLRERRDPSVFPRLSGMARDGKDHRLALEALWALYAAGGMTDDLAMDLLGHPGEHVRAWVVRLLGDDRRLDPEFLAKFRELAKGDPSPTVRSQLASTCKRLPGPESLPIVEELLGRGEDVADAHIPLLLWWAIEDKSVSDRDRVLALVGSASAWDRPIARSAIVERLARRYLAEANAEGYASCARLLALAPDAPERERLIRAMEEQMGDLCLATPPGTLAAALAPMLASDAPSSALVRLSARLGIADAVPIASARALESARPAAERAGFVRLLGELRPPAPTDRFIPLLDAGEPVEVRAEALQALARRKEDEVASAVLEAYPSMPGTLRDKARDVLVSRPGWSGALEAAVESGAIPAAEVRLEQVRRVVLHGDATLTARAGKLWGQVRPATSREKDGRILALTQILGRQPGKPALGRPIAAKLCLNCHKLFGEGETIAPDLTGADRKNLDILLRNVVDPSAVIREGFEQRTVATTDGRVLPGLVSEAGDGTITIVDARGVKTTLLEGEVEQVSRTDASLMPEGILDPLSDQEIRDLFAYLRSDPSASPARASR